MKAATNGRTTPRTVTAICSAEPANPRKEQPIDATWKGRWVEALRSGRYLQARSALEGPPVNSPAHPEDSERNGFCCLGVLCDLYDPNRWAATGLYAGYNADGDEVELEAYPPDDVLDAVGLSLVAAHKLGAMNDGAGDDYNEPATFAEIADYIERTL